MGFLGNWLLKITDKARERRDEKNVNGVSMSEPHEDAPFGQALSINVYNAHGGKIVTFYFYDKHNDRRIDTTYIIHPDEEFSESLGKLIAIEDIKHAGR